MTARSRPAAARDALTDRLYDMFRSRGFDGVSIGDVSAATGLGKSSLYHHFPGGKDDMALAVARAAHAWLVDHVIAPMRAEGSRDARIDRMITGIATLFDGGGAPCLIMSMSMPGAPDAVRDELRRALAGWIAGIADALTATGVPGGLAADAAQAAVSRIEGALSVGRALGDAAIFTGQLAQVRRDLIAL